MPSCHATRRKHEGWDTAILSKPKLGKSRCRGQVRTTDIRALLRPIPAKVRVARQSSIKASSDWSKAWIQEPNMTQYSPNAGYQWRVQCCRNIHFIYNTLFQCS
ncbi:hypothetical protein T265_01640 [Opisthorchis viverrini]|uniref:Uncharacterized protein n=1 Tax=Opisthorchis viverrini TaxID=6198 RepID=A0A074ZYS9_OPIVI|nr:hypothetical protein T265_01640 [Opisthorchis viverrini]KER32206.1 hypothetical protein T265_01640 [Opisthorchis viverrini]